MSAIDYVMSFYGPDDGGKSGGIYADWFPNEDGPPGCSVDEAVRALRELRSGRRFPKAAEVFSGEIDSTDREIVRDVMFLNRGRQPSDVEWGHLLTEKEKS